MIERESWVLGDHVNPALENTKANDNAFVRLADSLAG